MSASDLDFRRLFEAAPALFLVLTPQLTIAAASDAYLRATMLEREVVLGRYMFAVFPDNPGSGGSSNEGTVRESLIRVLATKKPDTLAVLKYDIRRPESEGGGYEERYWSAVNSPVLGNDGQIEFIIHRVEDVTEYVRERKLGGDAERRTEELQLRAERAEVEILLRGRELQETARALELSNTALVGAKTEADQANRAKSAFLASMSHEIRTPLNGVIGNIELLAQTTLNDDQFALLDDADKAATALLALIGNILDFSKIEAGKLALEVSDINLVDIVEEAVDILQSRARQKNIFIVATFSADAPQLVRGDGTRLRQILLNLLGNAVKFTEEGGVHITQSITAWDGPLCEMKFEVHDSGPGFSLDTSRSLFKPFVQDGSSSRVTEGTGLGLSISRSLVEALGGSIGCEGVPGEGATFWFTLPMLTLQRAESVIKPDLTGKRVLILGPDSDTAVWPMRYFRERGAVIEVSYDYAEALAELRDASKVSRRPDLAVVVPAFSEREGLRKLSGELRQYAVVPLLYDTETSWPALRRALRDGYSLIISPTPNVQRLDRNIRLLLGQAPARERLERTEATLTAYVANSFNGKRALVLEDRLVNQTVIQKQLKQLGVECDLAPNGVKGLEKVEEKHFDIILCDCSMPEMNGYDFTRALRRREAAAGGGHRTPVVALTANAFREDAEKCFQAGMDDFISKPVTLDRLAAVLTKWLQSSGIAISAATVERDIVVETAGPIDVRKLTVVLGTNEPSILLDILTQYRSSVEESQERIEIAVENGGAEAVLAAAHAAKGEALSAGANTLANIYIELEHLTKTKDASTDDLKRLTAKASVEVARIREFIDNRVKA